MNRRDLIRSLAALPMVSVMHAGKEVGKKIEIDPKAKYIVFLNSGAVDLDDFCTAPNSGLPDGTPVYPVHACHDLDQVIRIYKLEDA